ncbi:MAG: T9SS type A sorting domain-containing protein [Lewinella sp.]|jgi:hypothetical protein|uniref:T9SS type A sorting domain-containing protein n=1 Tax=Lewinella sp. TaxID=2004506 RepID=UPI003D6A624B
MYQRKQQTSTTRRQWRYLSSRVRQWVKDGSFANFTSTKQAFLRGRLRQLFQQMLRLEKVSSLRKALGGAILLLGLGATPAQAQVNFAPLEENPFGLMTHDEIRFETLADIDGDGDLDIVSVSYTDDGGYEDNQILEFRENQSTNDGTLANFTKPVSDAFGIILPSLEDGNMINPVLADLDGDGDLDLLIGSYIYGENTDGGIFYFQNTGDAQNPVFGEPQINPFGMDSDGSTAFTPKLADIDGDGDLDLFSIFYDYSEYIEENGIMFQENTGTATAPAFGAVQRDIFGLPTSFENIIFLEFGDLDNDGDVDILAGSPYYDYYDYSVSYQYYENTGTATGPSFADVAIDPFGLEPQSALFLWPMLGDLDNDGDLDVLTGATYNEFTEVAGWGYQENLLLNVAVEELADEFTQIEVFPTVSQGVYNLQIRTEESPLAVTLKVFNTNGQLLQQQDYPATTQLDEQLQLDSYPAGTYYLKLQSEQKQWTGKVIKQ